MTKAAAAPAKVPAVAPDLPLDQWTHEQVCAVFPKEPAKPLGMYSVTELTSMKGFGPSVLGGALYLASQKATATSHEGALGPAITSKGFTPVPFVSESQ